MKDIQTKKQYQQLHANKRFSQRLGIHFNRHRAREIIASLKELKIGKAIPTHMPGRTWFKIRFEFRIIWILYDDLTKRIVTVLPGDTPVENLNGGNVEKQ